MQINSFKILYYRIIDSKFGNFNIIIKCFAIDINLFD